jgi:hypothetical protein
LVEFDEGGGWGEIRNVKMLKTKEEIGRKKKVNFED